MKGIVGNILFFGGVVALMFVISENQSAWTVMLFSIPIGIGLNLIIDDKIETAKNELIDELQDQETDI